MIEITIFDRYLPIIDAFSGSYVKTLHTEDIGSIRADAIVSPANSFGFMDGGIDFAYLKHFGMGLQNRVRNEIDSKCKFGELLVGEALIINLFRDDVKNLIVAPTMRVPKLIVDYADIMLAARASVSLALACGLQSIAIPGMGTGCGNVPPVIAARAMIEGFNQAIVGPKLFENIVDTTIFHRNIGIGSVD